MNIFALSGLLIGITGGAEALLMFIKGKRKFHYLWGIFCISVLIWGMGGYKIALTLDPDWAVFWWKITYIGVIFIPIFLVHFTYKFLEMSGKWIIVIFYTLGFIFLTFNLASDLFINKVRLVFNQFYYISPPAPLYTPFILMFIGLVIYSLLKLYQAYRLAQGVKRAQLKYIFIALAIGFSGGSFSFLPVYKIDFYPVFNLTVPLGILVVAYAIIRYRLMDIRIVAKRIFIYFGVAAFTYGTFYLVAWIYQSQLGNVFSPTGYLAGLVIAPVFVVSLYGVERLLKIIANKYFFVSLYNYQKTINQLANELNYYFDLDKIIGTIVGTIKQTMQLDRAGVLLINQNKKPVQYQVAKVIGFNEQNGISLVKDNFLTQYLQRTQKPLVREELTLLIRDAKIKKEQESFKRLYEHMTRIEASLCLPLVSSNKLIGIIVLGSKISHDAYTKEDLDLLDTLSKQAGIAVENAQLYQEVQDFNKTLKQKVAEQTADLKAQAEHLKKLLQMRSEFLDIASHQLKTPVSVILGTISLFQEGSIQKLPLKQQHKFINNIFYKAKKLSTIINDILRASEMDTDEFQLIPANIKPTQPEELVQSVYEDLKPEADEKGLKLELVKPKKNLAKILADADFLEQAIYNLTDNAIKYTAKGKVKISLSQEQNRIIIRIADSGIGIPQADQKKMFDKFSRAKNAVNMYTDGSGLGLFIVKKIVEAHQGGQISFTSEENKGTTFVVTLPIKQIK